MGTKKIKTLSLFSGAGGLDIGFHNAGFDIVACVELEEKYCKTLIENKKNRKYFHNNTDIHNVDIRKFDVSPYKNLGIECLIGGPPCQTFSAAGRRSGGVIGTDDQRGQLYGVYCEILDVLQPEVFVFENVYGLPGANGGKPWREILTAFSEHGYTLTSEVVDTADYGVPQHRERLIMVGTKSDKFSFPIPLVGPDSKTNKPLVSVLDAIFDLQSKSERYGKGLGGLYGHLLPDVPEGLNYAYFTAEMGHPEPVFAWRSKFHDLLYKVNRKQPCRTIKANPGKFTGPLHWKNRHFTTDELKRLQTFPDDYEIIGSYGQVVEQIGNSVPPKLAEIIATSVREQILRPKKTLTYKIRSESFQSTFRQRQRERSKEFKLIAKKHIKKKYGSIKTYAVNEKVRSLTVKYYASYKSKFDREKTERKPNVKDDVVLCVLTEACRHVRLDVDSINTNENAIFNVEIKITGLSKYLPSFDSLTVSASIPNEMYIFYVWKEIEDALVSRSKFFTLIDIYGHYANRGDVVNVTSHINMDVTSLLINMISYFSQTANCGDFLSESDVQGRFGVNKQNLYKAIAAMRKMRYDIRTYDTHPIIGAGNILCTYPFPLLSKKALVMSKVKLNKGKLYA